MTSEVQEILLKVENFSSEKSLHGVFAESSTERSLLIVLLISFVTMSVLFIFKSLHFWALISGLIFIFALVGLVVVQALEVVVFNGSPLKGFAKQTSHRLDIRSAFIDDLASYKPEDLRQTVEALERDVSKIQRRLYIMVGAVEKVGFIPAAIALYFAGSKIVAGESDASANLLACFVLGFYGAAFLGHRLIELLSINIVCLREATIQSESRIKLGRQL